MGVKQLQSGIWQIDHRYVLGRRRIRESGFRSKREANGALAARRADFLRENYGFVKARCPKFALLVNTYISLYAKVKKRSWDADEQRAKKYLLPAFGEQALDLITPEMISHQVKKWLESISNSTVNRILALGKHTFNWAIRQDMGISNVSKRRWHIRENPFRFVEMLREPPGRNRILTPEEEERFFRTAAPHVAAMSYLARNTGMRLGEIRNLKWEEIDWNRKVITLTNTKNGEDREVPMNTRVIELLEKQPHKGDYIFTNNGGRYTRIDKGMRAALRRAGIKNFSFHGWRHMFETQAAEIGIDPIIISDITGHKTLAMRRRYTHPQLPRKLEAVERINGHFLDTSPPNHVGEELLTYYR